MKFENLEPNLLSGPVKNDGKKPERNEFISQNRLRPEVFICGKFPDIPSHEKMKIQRPSIRGGLGMGFSGS